MTNLQKRILAACDNLGLAAQLDYVLELPSGHKLICPVHIPSLGFSRGMLLFSSFDQMEGNSKEIRAQGYGFSILSDFGADLSRESAIALFSDWTWNGPVSTRPPWMKDRSP